MISTYIANWHHYKEISPDRQTINGYNYIEIFHLQQFGLGVVAYFDNVLGLKKLFKVLKLNFL